MGLDCCLDGFVIAVLIATVLLVVNSVGFFTVFIVVLVGADFLVRACL